MRNAGNAGNAARDHELGVPVVPSLPLGEQMRIFDQLPREIRDWLNYEACFAFDLGHLRPLVGRRMAPSQVSRQVSLLRRYQEKILEMMRHERGE